MVSFPRKRTHKRKPRVASRKVGLPPGTLVHVGEHKTEKVRITVIDYDGDNFQERELDTARECATYRDKPTVTWINVDGLHDVSVIEDLGRCYDLHPLLMEDILHTGQRPKAEDFEKYVSIVLQMLYVHEEDGNLDTEQVSLVLGENFVLTFQERQGDVFDSVRTRLRTDKGRLRKMGADYLAYALIDAVVDNYFVVLEALGERIADLEEEVVGDPARKTLTLIYGLKREMISVRRSIWPLREVISGLERGESPLFSKPTLVYLRDVYDHTIQVIDTVESYRDTVSGLIDVYLSSISNRMNDVMKVLTIIATIFIPLTFIAGIYGMNFEFMPELHWKFGYFGALLVMAIIGLVMIAYFRRKNWL